MVSIIENWALIRGKVLSITSNDKLKGYSLVSMLPEEADDIDEFPNLAKQDIGNEIKINVKTAELEKKNIAVNKELVCKARKAFGQVYFIK